MSFNPLAERDAEICRDRIRRMSLRSIGDKWQLSSERVRQILALHHVTKPPKVVAPVMSKVFGCPKSEVKQTPKWVLDRYKTKHYNCLRDNEKFEVSLSDFWDFLLKNGYTHAPKNRIHIYRKDSQGAWTVENLLITSAEDAGRYYRAHST